MVGSLSTRSCSLDFVRTDELAISKNDPKQAHHGHVHTFYLHGSRGLF